MASYLLRKKNGDDSGATMVEYGLLVAMDAVMSLTAVTLVGERTEHAFTDTSLALAGDEEAKSQPDTPGESDGGDDSGEDENNDDTGPGGDQQEYDNQGSNVDDPGNDDPGKDDPSHKEIAPGLSVTEADSDLTKWDTTGGGGKGEWSASVSYQNDTDRHQHLKLEVTMVDDKDRTTTTIDSFPLPAHGSSTFSQGANELRINPSGVKGVTEVTVRVVSVTTSDESWKPYSFDVTAEPTSVLAPVTP